MTFRPMILGIVAAMSAPAWAESPAPAAPAAVQPAIQKAPPVSPEKLEAVRQAMRARIAAFDTTEQVYRIPTTDEQQALSRVPSSRTAPRVVALPNGGAAISGAAAEMSFLVVDVQADGTTSMRHAESLKSTNKAVSKKGDHHAHQ